MKKRNGYLWAAGYECLYRIAERLPIIRGYLKVVHDKIYDLCPMEEQRLRKTTLKICVLAWSLACFIFYIMFIRSPSVYSFILSCFYIVVIAGEVIRFEERQIERRVLKQTEKMLNDVRHFYYDTHFITRALQEAESDAGYEMRIHMEIILGVLTSENISEAVEEYNRNLHNRFLKLFLSQCVAIQEYGDTERNGESMFVRNMGELREDILNHLLQLDRLQMEFGGLTFITLVPLLVLPVIKSAAIGTLPELGAFYGGTLGRILPFVYLVVTQMVYRVITEVQEMDAGFRVRRWISRIENVRFVSTALACWEKRHYGKSVRMKRKIRMAGEQLTVRQLFLEKVLLLCGSVILAILLLMYAKQPGEYLGWHWTGVILLCGVIAYYVPDLRIRYKRTLMQMNMFSEVTQFQSIIMMQMFIPDITVLRILTTMEQFAHVFRKSIQDCINEYSHSVNEALHRMKDAESYEMFRRLCDKFLSVDKIGVARAFEEIIQDRMQLQKRREADTYRLIKKKADYAKVLAFVPMVMIMITYLVLPYGIEAVRQFSMILEELNSL